MALLCRALLVRAFRRNTAVFIRKFATHNCVFVFAGSSETPHMKSIPNPGLTLNILDENINVIKAKSIW